MLPFAVFFITDFKNLPSYFLLIRNQSCFSGIDIQFRNDSLFKLPFQCGLDVSFGFRVVTIIICDFPIYFSQLVFSVFRIYRTNIIVRNRHAPKPKGKSFIQNSIVKLSVSIQALSVSGK